MQEYMPETQPTYADLSPLYVQIMVTCQPFYELPTQQKVAGTTGSSSSLSSFTIPPRLEDGLAAADRTRSLDDSQSQQENPQDC